jgi:hypothetical protein
MIDRLVYDAEALTLADDSYRTHQRRERLSKETAQPSDRFYSSARPEPARQRGRFTRSDGDALG